ncbi:alpha/beta hydrolase family protein [Aliikangiella sp. IMCC44632]
MSLTLNTIQSSDGAQFQLQHTPQTDTISAQTPLMLCLPAMGVPARSYLPLALQLQQRGLLVATFEQRGLGTSNLRASHATNFGYAETLQSDLPLVFEHLKSKFPQNPIYIVGHSLGGQLGLAYAGLNPGQVAGFIGVATGTPFYKIWSFPANISLVVASYLMRAIAFVMGYFPGRKLGFGGREARQIISDWSFTVRTGNFKAKGLNRDIEASLAQLKLNALMLTFSQDILAPPSSSRALIEKIATPASFHHFSPPELPHHLLGHFNWMREPDLVVNKIIQWLKIPPS